MANEEQFISKYTAAEIEAMLDKVKTDMQTIQYTTSEVYELLQKIDETTVPTVPSDISAFNNDVHYITNAVNNLANYYSKSVVNDLLSLQNSNALFQQILKAPLHDVSETIPDNDLVTDYNIDVKNIIFDGDKRIIPVIFSGTNLKQHTNAANTEGYWMGISLPEDVLLSGYTVQYARGFGNNYNINELTFENMTAEFFNTDVNVSPTGKWCSCYREVSQAKQNNGHAFFVLKLNKSGLDSFYYIYDYDYTNVTLDQ